MGCASSSPLISGAGGPGGIVDNAKMSGENVLNEVEHTIQETIGHVKGAVGDAMHSVTNGIDEAIHGKKEAAKELKSDINEMTNGMNGEHNDHDENKENNDSNEQFIPLKDVQHKMNENFENMKNDMKKRADDTMDDAEQMANDLMKETEDVMRDAETGIIDAMTVTDVEETMQDGHVDILDLENKTPTHSIDSLKTGSPEPEIERILDDDERMKTPEATLTELENMTQDETMQAHDMTAKDPDNKDAVKSIILFMTDQMKYSNFDFSADSVRSLSVNDLDERARKDSIDEAKHRLRLDLTDWELLADEVSRSPLHKPTTTKSTSVESIYFQKPPPPEPEEPLDFHYIRNGETQIYDACFANMNAKTSPTDWEKVADDMYAKATEARPMCVASSTSIESIFLE